MRRLIIGLAVITMLAASCTKEPEGDCLISFSFSKDYTALIEELRTKGGETLVPDTNDFILSIKNEEGEEIYYGAYGKKPERMAVEEGTYVVKVISVEFESPAFNMPQYGDSLSVDIGARSEVNISFLCKQMNAGMKINYSSEFRTKYPSSKVVLVGPGGTLEYPYTETRIAYFSPGKVSMRMETGGASRHILSRNISMAEVLSINMSVGAEEMIDANFRLMVDTSCIWITENYEYGKENDGSTRNKALTVLQAIDKAGEVDIWVRGFIVGGDATSASFSTSGPFKSNTNLIIAASAAESERGKCMAVELKAGEIRDSLNLVMHPELFHKEIFVKGTIVDHYFGLTGLKGVKEFYKE